MNLYKKECPDPAHCCGIGTLTQATRPKGLLCQSWPEIEGFMKTSVVVLRLQAEDCGGLVAHDGAVLVDHDPRVCYKAVEHDCEKQNECDGVRNEGTNGFHGWEGLGVGAGVGWVV